jgi:hypothetical protein
MMRRYFTLAVSLLLLCAGYAWSQTRAIPGVTSTGSLLVTGPLRGNISISSYAANQTLTTDELRGAIIMVTATATLVVPAVDATATGLNFCVYSTTAAAVYVDPNAADRIVLDGTALADGDKLKSASAAGDYICLVNDTNAGWRTLGRSGAWTDDN